MHIIMLSNKKLPQTFHIMWSLLEKGICRKIWKENIEMLIVISLRVRLEVILSYTNFFTVPYVLLTELQRLL